MNVKERIAAIQKTWAALDKKSLVAGSSSASKENVSKVTTLLAKQAPTNFTQILEVIAPIYNEIVSKRKDKQDSADRGLLTFFNTSVFSFETVDAIQDEVKLLQTELTKLQNQGNVASTSNGTATTGDNRTSAEAEAMIASLRIEVANKQKLIENLQNQLANSNAASEQPPTNFADRFGFSNDDNMSVASGATVATNITFASRAPTGVALTGNEDERLYNVLMREICQSLDVPSMFSESDAREICAIVSAVRILELNKSPERQQLVKQLAFTLRDLFLEGARKNVKDPNIFTQHEKLYSRLITRSPSGKDSSLPPVLKDLLYAPSKDPKNPSYGELIKKFSLQNKAAVRAPSNVTATRGATRSATQTPRRGVTSTVAPTSAAKRTAEAADVVSATPVKKANSGLTAGDHPSAFQFAQPQGRAATITAAHDDVAASLNDDADTSVATNGK